MGGNTAQFSNTILNSPMRVVSKVGGTRQGLMWSSERLQRVSRE